MLLVHEGPEDDGTVGQLGIRNVVRGTAMFRCSCVQVRVSENERGLQYGIMFRTLDTTRQCCRVSIS